MTRKKTVLLLLPLAVALVAAVFGFKIHAQLARGEQVFWLAALWPPAAVITIMLVVCIDIAVPGPRKAPADAPKTQA